MLQVLDRVHRVAYAALSQRCTRALAERWCAEMHYELVAFDTRDPTHNDAPLYHTNIVLSIGSSAALVCSDVIAAEHRAAVRNALGRHRTVVELSVAQTLTAFCGNALELRGGDGRRLLFMSGSAAEALSAEQRQALVPTHVDEIVGVHIPTLQTVGGGSVRCMIAELFAPVQ